jgi:hypothetical protein
MNRLYLITWEDKVALVNLKSLEDIDRDKLPGCVIFDIGLADPMTLPGKLFMGPADGLSKIYPLGRLIP